MTIARFLPEYFVNYGYDQTKNEDDMHIDEVRNLVRNRHTQREKDLMLLKAIGYPERIFPLLKEISAEIVMKQRHLGLGWQDETVVVKVSFFGKTSWKYKGEVFTYNHPTIPPPLRKRVFEGEMRGNKIVNLRSYNLPPEFESPGRIW